MNGESPYTTTHRQVIDKILDHLAEVEQPLPNSLEFFQRILTIQNKAKLPDLSKIPTEFAKNSVKRLSQGNPILSFADIQIDWEDSQMLFNELAELSIRFIAPAPNEIETLKQIGSNLNSLQKTTKIWFGDTTLPRKNNLKNNDTKPLASSILQATFYPLLAEYADVLLPLVSQDAWYKRYCPVCGGEPDFAFLDKEKDGARWLLCSRCDAQWLFYRLVCPHCGNDDQKKLAYLTDDTNLYRLYICEKCHRYLKAIDLRKTTAEILLPLERVLTLDLDRQAHESNYKTD